MIHTDLSPRLHHSSLAAAALAAVAAEGQSPTSVSMPQSSFPQKTPFAIQELLGLTNDHSSDTSNDLKNHHGTNNGHLDACSGGFSAAAAAAAMVSSVSSYNNRSFMSQAAHQAFSAAVSGNEQYNNRMYFNTGLFGSLQSPGGFGSAAAAAAAVAAQSMSPGGGGGGGSSGMSHHLFDPASFRNEHGFPG